MIDFNYLGAGIEKENMFGGIGRFRAWPFRKLWRHAPFAAALMCEISPGGHVGEVVVDDCSETICVISGSAWIRINGEAYTVQAGQSIDVARNSRLGVANSSAELPLQYLLQKID